MTCWQTMRFKPPPPHSKIGWRVEFRPCELQVTDFENAAICCFIVLLTRSGQKRVYLFPPKCESKKNDSGHRCFTFCDFGIHKWCCGKANTARQCILIAKTQSARVMALPREMAHERTCMLVSSQIPLIVDQATLVKKAINQGHKPLMTEFGIHHMMENCGKCLSEH